MEFHLEISDSAFENSIRAELIKLINVRARAIALEVERENGALIDAAIKRYLDTNLSGDNLKRVIDASVIEALRDKINEL